MPSPVSLEPLQPNDNDLVALGECQALCFGDLGTTALRKEPEPRLAPELRYAGTGLRIGRMLRFGARGLKAVQDGRAIGYILWQEPGWRAEPVPLAEREAEMWQGMDIAYYNSFLADHQNARDALMGDESYWCGRLPCTVVRSDTLMYFQEPAAASRPPRVSAPWHRRAPRRRLSRARRCVAALRPADHPHAQLGRRGDVSQARVGVQGAAQAVGRPAG